jgi:hypothetical protein
MIKIEIKPSDRIRIGFWIIGVIFWIDTTLKNEMLSGKIFNTLFFMGFALICDTAFVWAFSIFDETRPK